MSALPRRRLLQAAALMLCLPRPAEAAALIRDAVRRLLAERLRHEGVGLAVARFDGAAIDLAAAGPTGLAGEAIDVARHRFEIGSITKTLVGVLLADAVWRRELALEQTVESLLPDGQRLRDSASEPIPLVDFATHRSGLPRLPCNLEPTAAPCPADPYAVYDDAALMAVVRQFKTTRARDAQQGYSNFGFGLLAWLIARRPSLSCPSCSERLFQPLGLTGMVRAAPWAAGQDNAEGHNPAGQPMPAWHFLALGGAGALRPSSAERLRASAVRGL